MTELLVAELRRKLERRGYEYKKSTPMPNGEWTHSFTHPNGGLNLIKEYAAVRRVVDAIKKRTGQAPRINLRFRFRKKTGYYSALDIHHGALKSSRTRVK